MQLPQKLLESLKRSEGFDESAFEKAHDSAEQVVSIRINPKKKFDSQHLNFETSPVPWCSFGYYLRQRPAFTFDPLFHAGCYYVQEASSMFLEQALKQTVDLSQPLRVLDVAAAPGGKSTHIHSLLSGDSLLVSNEVINSRRLVLKDNLIKWGTENVVVTGSDPRVFSKLENYFDVIVVDAPCSGSGLFRKEPQAAASWSEDLVNLCQQRQRRILAEVWPALKEDGILIYSTCSYSTEENEDILNWMHDQMDIKGCELKLESSWNVIQANTQNHFAAYRFWPDKVKGEGFFIACLKKTTGGERTKFRANRKWPFLSNKETQLSSRWIRASDRRLVKHNNTVYAVPEKLLVDMTGLSDIVQVIYFGTEVGGLAGEKFIPAHPLAMSGLISPEVERTELDREQAIVYLKKKELREINAASGWRIVTHKNCPLGWINVLPNRINNYYPKEMRILRDI